MIRIILLVIFGGWFAFFAFRAVASAVSFVLDLGIGGHNSSAILGVMAASVVCSFLFAWLFKRAYAMKPPTRP